MLQSLTNVLDSFSLATFEPSQLQDFPREEYEKQLARYREAEQWFTGAMLDVETQNKQQGEKIDLYPLRINPLISTVMKHAAILFGETEDDSRPLVIPKPIPDTEPQKDMAKQIEDFLNYVWWENNGHSLMLENGIMSQIYGGCFFKIGYAPWEVVLGKKKFPFRIEAPNPKTVVATSDDGFRLLECWIVKQIPRVEAVTWGYTGDDSLVWLVEYWNEAEYSITIDGKAASRQIGNERKTMMGDNIWGVVPVTYIPHIRVGGFKGINAIDQLTGIVKELNLRFADYGDAVNDDSHGVVAMKNVTGSPRMRRVAPYLNVVDIGSATNMTSHDPEPDLFEVRSQRASMAMQTLLQELYAEYRRDSYVPAVAEGEDEGSQRSGLTLAMRFWPLTSHAGMERKFWTSGLNAHHTTLLRMAEVAKIAKITAEHREMRLKHQWHPMLPRDREADVAEWVARAGSDLGSPWHLLGLTGDVEDIDDEIKKMLKWLDDKLALEAKHAIQQPFGGESGGTGTSSSARTPAKREGGSKS